MGSRTGASWEPVVAVVEEQESGVPGIIWLASYPKSGSTWLRAFLANMIAGAERPVAINELPNYAFGDNNLAHYRDFTGRDPADFTAEEIAALRPRIHDWFARSRPHDVFVKTHNAVLTIGGVPLITPGATAGAIYVARNPLDVAVSFAHHYELPLQRAVNGLCRERFVLAASDGHLPQYLGSWSRHVTSWLDAPGLTLHCLRYEDVVANDLEAFAGVVRFLRLPEDPARLERAAGFSRFEELAGQEQGSGFIEARREGLRFFREGRVGSWREALSEAQVAQIVAAHRPVMARLGYLSESGEPAF
ncbi:MAG: sulfotransferase domain-containing protein [Kiloniellales bacterium]